MKKCKTCGFRGLDAQSGLFFCRISKMYISDEDFCSYHCEDPQTCFFCGSPLIPHSDSLVIEVDDGYAALCPNCAQHYGTCPTCIHQNECKFMDQNFRPDIPPVVMKTQQQGMMVVQTQVKNPERENICCPGCICRSEGGFCFAAFTQSCGNYKCGYTAS